MSISIDRRPAARGFTIAIDGPAGSGKSTLGAALAHRLGYTYFDSGVVYRALTWLALRANANLHDEAALVRLARETEISAVRPTVEDGRQFSVIVGDEDATWEIRSADVDRNVSIVAAHPRVRQALTEQLRQIASRGSMVMVGRDIGTVVLPDADLKIYLTASDLERARRRHGELIARKQNTDFEAILADLRRRDALDGGRETAPMRPAEDAILLNSDHLTVEEEIQRVIHHLVGRGRGRGRVASSE